MSVKAGTAWVDFQGDYDGLLGGLEKALAPVTGKFGKFGKAAAIGVAGIGAAAVGAGAALFKIGENFDDAYDTIRVGTGKTGKQLEGLKDSFRDVVKMVPTDFETASKAITKVSQRLGASGPMLTQITRRFLELSRITGTDVSTNIETVSRAFGDWGVKTQDQTSYMDKLFRASQATGVPVSKLAETITKFGGPLRQLGFGFDEATAMAAKFEKEGVNTELVLGSMRIALGKMARDGEKPVQTLRRVTEQIKNAGSAGEANKLALELFGARAGPDMAAAIREGRFEVGKLTDTIANGRENIIKAGNDTQDFSEKWQMFKNRVLVALEPIATRVFDGIGKAMDFISRIDFAAALKAVKGLGDEFSGLGDIVSGVIDALTAVWNKFGDLIIKGAADLVEAIKGFAEGVVKLLRGVVDFIAGIFTGDWTRAWDGIKEIISGAWTAIKNVVTGVVGQMVNAVQIALRAFATVLSEIWNGVKDTVSTIWKAIRDFVKDRVDDIVDFIKNIPTRLANFVGLIFDGIKDAMKAAKDFVKDRIDDVVDFVRNIPTRLANFVSEIFNGIGSAIKAVKDFVKDKVDDLVGFVRDIPDRIPKALFQPIIDAWNTAFDFVKDHPIQGSVLIRGVLEGVADAIPSGKKPVISGNPDQQGFRRSLSDLEPRAATASDSGGPAVVQNIDKYIVGEQDDNAVAARLAWLIETA